MLFGHSHRLIYINYAQTPFINRFLAYCFGCVGYRGIYLPLLYTYRDLKTSFLSVILALTHSYVVGLPNFQNKNVNIKLRIT